MEPTDWHDLAEARFLERLAETLDASVRTGEAKTIILIAPPRALGVLREHLSPAVRNATKFEIAKDLVRMPTSAIEEFLQTEGELS
jgi:protein required for attachment to host cells